MSGHSYPSPVSSTTSPSVDDHPPLATRVMPEILSRDHTDTQRNLHQASAALEAAYRRIRQVRRSLLELSDTLPIPDSQPRFIESGDVGPAHQAIMLTGALVDDPVLLEDVDLGASRQNTTSPLMERVRRHEARLENDLLGADRTSRSREQSIQPSNTLRRFVQTTSLNSPVSPNRHPRRSILETQLSRRREILSDDSNTALGRRVAAREAAGSSNPPNPWDGSTHRLPLVTERDLEQLRSSLRPRRTEPPMESNRPSEAEIRATRSLDVNSARRATQGINVAGVAATNPQGLPWPPPETRRWRSLRSENRAPSQSPINSQPDRLSLLSNFSVQNLSTPRFTVTRPLLFDEPSSYMQGSTSPPLYPEYRDDVTGVSVEERNYVVRRRLNADGEEHVHPITLDWNDDDRVPWLRDYQDEPSVVPPRPRAPTRQHQRNDTVQVPRADSTSTPDDVQRRRGWARLDLDGNEIPSDEEEALERDRTEVRVRALYEARLGANLVDEPQPSALRLRTRAPNLSLTSVILDEDPTYTTDSLPRVRLGVRGTRVLYGAREMSDDGDRRHSSSPSSQYIDYDYPPAVPFSPCPLPMPLADMVSSVPKTSRTERVVRVSRHASLAGR